jgi:hypothetical protein
MGRNAEVREIYECEVCGFKLTTFIPTEEAVCPNTHTVKKGSRTILGRIAMTKTYDRSKGAA